MIVNYQKVLNWDATETARPPHSVVPALYNSATLLFNATAQKLLLSTIQYAANVNDKHESDLTSFAMAVSEDSFSEIWEDPEEDIWDNL